MSFLAQDSLHSLMTMLGQANPYFVRCIKPNVEKLPDRFLPQVVLNQLKYSGEGHYTALLRIHIYMYKYVQGLFQDFTQEGANALWQISRGGGEGGNNILLNIGKPIAKWGTSISRGAKAPPAPLK